MSEPFSRLLDSEIRSICKERIEALEYWLRRLIHDTLTPKYGDYFAATDSSGQPLLKQALREKIASYTANDPARYPRKIDATVLDDAIYLLCHPAFWPYFRAPLHGAYPHGRDEVRTFLERLIGARNNLAHANAVSVRQAEQVVCYSNDVIASLKAHYRAIGMQQDFNVPMILRYSDSFGQSFPRDRFSSDMFAGGTKVLTFHNEPQFYLRPGDTLTIEVEVDPSFDPSTYSVKWAYSGSPQPATFETEAKTKLVIPVTNAQVSERFQVTCEVRTQEDWHRYGHTDDMLNVLFKVLPPLI